MELERKIEQAVIQTQCLHLGRSGERCVRAALEDGFCERHGPAAVWRFNLAARRRIFAILLGAAILWPILAEIWRALHR